MSKGQYLRLFLSIDDDPGGVEPIGAATNMTFHVAANAEQSSTKDTEGNWDEYEITGLSYDISSDALVLTDDGSAFNIDDLFGSYTNAQDELAFKISSATGDNQRTPDALLCSGLVVATNVQVTAQNRQNSTISISLSGKSALTIGS